MSAGTKWGRRSKSGVLFIGAMVGAGALALPELPAGAAVPAAATSSASAFFSSGSLVVVGGAQDESIVIGRDAAGTIQINGGAVLIKGGRPTVANTRLITALGNGGNDVISIDEVNGAMPRANLIGGTGNDTLTGGSGADQLIGQAGNDNLRGKDGADVLSGGADNDALTGGAGDDSVFGDAGNDA